MILFLIKLAVVVGAYVAGIFTGTKVTGYANAKVKSLEDRITAIEKAAKG